MSTPGLREAPWLTASALLVCLSGPVSAGSAEPASAVAQSGTPALLSLATWAVAARDARGRPFVIVDKVAAKVFAFDAAGALVGETPALLGVARGDASPPGIGTLRLADISPALRITPAGRYEAHLGTNLAGHSILWVDYDDGLSLHAVVTGNAAERRLERLATPSILDNRISYGCINVPARFYEQIIEPLFAPTGGIVIILPETATSGE